MRGVSACAEVGHVPGLQVLFVYGLRVTVRPLLILDWVQVAWNILYTPTIWSMPLGCSPKAHPLIRHWVQHTWTGWSNGLRGGGCSSLGYPIRWASNEENCIKRKLWNASKWSSWPWAPPNIYTPLYLGKQPILLNKGTNWFSAAGVDNQQFFLNSFLRGIIFYSSKI